MSEDLARAWLSLCGWRPGMVDAGGDVYRCPSWEAEWLARAAESRRYLPDLAHPANWGHWTVALYGDAYPPHIPWNKDYPRRLLYTYVIGRADDVPPDVLAWWREQGDAP